MASRPNICTKEIEALDAKINPISEEPRSSGEVQQEKNVINWLDFLSPFDIRVPWELFTDVSGLGCLAYVLTQPTEEENNRNLIKCDSIVPNNRRN